MHANNKSKYKKYKKIEVVGTVTSTSDRDRSSLISGDGFFISKKVE